eukprot:scaffold721_cov131-Cylindrotheca_fusiformis.AAC.75
MSPSSARHPNAEAKGTSHSNSHVQNPRTNSRHSQNATPNHLVSRVQGRDGIGNGGNGQIEGKKISRTTQSTPLFEDYLEHSEDIKSYQRTIDSLKRRIAGLERGHGDLESRLESVSIGRMQLETTLEEREQDWALKFSKLAAERDDLEKAVKDEQRKNTRLRDQVVRKDKDIHRMLQRKYDNPRESPMSHSIRNVRPLGNERQTGNSQPPTDTTQRGAQNFRTLHEILAASGSMDYRQNNAQNLLMDFFAL